MDTREPSQALSGDLADNPYVGPRTFDPKEYWKFFGRERETRELIARIISGRLLLFYAQSGAGKSSLLNTRIIPGLIEEGFEVLPIGSVSGHSGFESRTDNIFIYNLLSSLDQRGQAYSEDPDQQLFHFLDNLVCDSGIYVYDEAYDWSQVGEIKPRVLIIDQFEELFTTNTAFWEHRQGFFLQLAEALAKDEQLWVVLTMRQDFVAELRPYRHLLPDDLRNQFYMQQLGPEDALMAIKSPVELPQYNRPFEKDAAELLVKNLLTIQVEGLEDSERTGEFVEPVQLQAVCYQMWEQLRERPGPTITEQDVRDFADVDRALIRFYEDTITQTVAETGVAESDLRHWFDTELVTEAGTRNMVYRGEDETGGLPSTVADCVRDKFILREVVRPGGIWYELVHDRFVHPIIDSNRDWYQHQPLLQLAQQWADSGRSEVFLLTSHQLEEFSATNWQALGPLVAEYVDASRAASDQRQQRRNRLRNLAILAVIAVLGVGLILLAGSLGVALQRTNQLTAEKVVREAAQATLEATQSDLVRRNSELTKAGEELLARRRALETANSELETTNAKLEALRLTDAASDMLSRGETDAAILLSYEASKNDDSIRVRSVFLDALQNKGDRIATATPVQGNYQIPVDAEGNPIAIGTLFRGPIAGSLATISEGHIYWWMPMSDEAPLAQRVDLPIDAYSEIEQAAFLPGGLLVTASGPDIRLWSVDDERVQQLGAAKAAGGKTITASAFSPDGSHVILGSACSSEQAAKNDQSAGAPCRSAIEVWSTAAILEGGAPDKTIEVSRPAIDMTFADNAGRRLIWTDGVDIAVEDLETGHRELVSRPDSQLPAITGLAASPENGLFVAVGCVPGDIVLDPATETPGQLGAAQATNSPARQCESGDIGWREWWFLGEENLVRVAGGAPDYRDVTYLPDGERFVFSPANPVNGSSFFAARLGFWQDNACSMVGRNLTAREWAEAHPELAITAYQPGELTCSDYPVHPSVIEALITECEAQRESLPNTPCWSRLLEIAGEPLDGDSLFAAGELIRSAGALTETRFTTAMRLLADAADTATALPDKIEVVLDDQIAAVYDAICAQMPSGRTDSPALLEACRQGGLLDLSAGEVTRTAEAEQRRWRFDGKAGESVTVVVDAPGDGGTTLTLYDELGKEVAHNDSGGSGQARLTALLSRDGSHTIEVGSYGSPVPYTITVGRTPAQPLTLDGMTREVAVDRQVWRFAGDAGEWVSLAADAPEGADATLTLYDASGEQVGYNDDFDGRDPQLTTVLPEGGQYTAVVGWYGSPQPYALTAARLTPDTLTLDGVPVSASPDQRFWQFNGMAGQPIKLGIAAMSSGDAMLSLYNSKGEQLRSNDNVNGSNPEIAFVLPADGVYTIDVGWKDAADDYTIAAAAVEPDPLTLDGVTREASADQRLWRFDGAAGELATIGLEALGDGDATLTLYDDAGKTIGYNDDFKGLNPQINVVLPADGPYTVEVGWLSTSAVNPYNLTGTLVAPQPLPPGGTVAEAAPDQRLWTFRGQAGNAVAVDLTSFEEALASLIIYGPDGKLVTTSPEEIAPRASATLLADGVYTVEVRWPEAASPYSLTLTTEAAAAIPPGGEVPRAEADQRLWRFRGTAGDTVTIAATALEGGDPTLTLYDAQGTQLSFNDDFNGLNPQITQRLTADGDYTITVGWIGAPAPYSLAVSTVTPVSLPESGQVAAEPDDKSWWFDGAAGEWVTIAVTAAEGDPRVALYDADGELLNQSDDFSDLNPLLTQRLPADGRYTIEVWWRDTSQPYTLSLLRAAPAPLPADGHVTGAGVDQRLWAFDGATGETVTVAVDAPAAANAWARLFDASGEPLAFSDNGDGLNPRIAYALPDTGTYVIEVGWFGEPAAYDLALERR